MKFLITFLFLLSYQSYGFNVLYPVVEDNVVVSQMMSFSSKNGYRAVSEAQTSNQANVIIRDGASKSFAGQDLRKVKFVGDFRNANFEGADLRAADLRGLKLVGANLFQANLSGADLRGADLRGAYLSDADLRKAKLNGAKLIKVNLSSANLSGVRF